VLELVVGCRNPIANDPAVVANAATSILPADIASVLPSDPSLLIAAAAFGIALVVGLL
jgi:hypothetical protein